MTSDERINIIKVLRGEVEVLTKKGYKLRGCKTNSGAFY